MKTQAIIPTAGLGVRFDAQDPKTLVSLKGKPVFIWTLMAFEKSGHVESVILVVHERYIKEYQELVSRYKLNKVSKIIAGGKARYDSVRNGIKSLDSDTKIVVIHDGARPLIETDIIDRSIKLCKKENAVIVAVPVKQTIKKLDDSLYVEDTIEREKVWEAQTPQIFERDLLVKAYDVNVAKPPTDDSFLVEKMGVKVKVMMGDYKNIKITTKEDLIIAEAFLKHKENLNA